MPAADVAAVGGGESLWYGLIEAAGCLADAPACSVDDHWPSVVLVYQDEPLPPPL